MLTKPILCALLVTLAIGQIAQLGPVNQANQNVMPYATPWNGLPNVNNQTNNTNSSNGSTTITTTPSSGGTSWGGLGDQNTNGGIFGTNPTNPTNPSNPSNPSFSNPNPNPTNPTNPNNPNPQNSNQNPGGSTFTPSATPIDPNIYNYWMSLWGARFGLNPQDNYRILVFNQNMRIIQDHNSSPEKTFTMRVNQFILLTLEEYAGFSLGELPSQRPGPARRLQSVVTQTATPINNVRPLEGGSTVSGSQQTGGSNTFGSGSSSWASLSWDWRQIGGAITPIKNQGACSSCYAFAVVSVAESMHMISSATYMPDLSEQQLVDCSGNYQNQGC
jgi:hypothetical protein